MAPNPPLIFFHHSPIPLIGSPAGELVLITARVTTEKTPGTCLYFSSVLGILPSSQPPISCSEEGAGNATLSPRMAEECIRVWSHEGLVLTKLLTSVRASSCWGFIECYTKWDVLRLLKAIYLVEKTQAL